MVFKIIIDLLLFFRLNLLIFVQHFTFMYTYRKPKDFEEAIKLVNIAGVNTNWDFERFDKHKPIVFIYKNDELIGIAHNKLDRPKVYDLMDRDVTSTYNKLVLAEIDMELRQLELF